ncbi:class II fructose-bisphosphate aldolase [Desulfobotulus sp.]|jgi:fructose/tagatose bisphosphate aldolase|uniref:class II fructose-bisphosphate aldolase n=1 Tax=Desulfobotulus sp. TaxID=1940337 RepID=UPI002A36672B|nr:class II fructose-bisphosphate aldolase [Desulfobotulus sp.]MDY0163015.1 class II fructose-bisphosphate aldolase [Desulfobotulus sp.]
MTLYNADFEKAVRIGRPPNITRLFPNSKALLVSGKYIDNAMIQKGGCMTIAANARSHIIIRGVLQAAQKANAAILIEIARSEGGADAYCPVSLWNMARQVDAIANELGITIPIAIHADHYGIKKESDLAGAREEIPSLFEAGITSIAIDASHMPDALNLLTNIAVSDLIPTWAGLETEVGEIKGNQGLSTPEEALFLIQGLNAHGIFPNWIALNNGTTHGIEANEDGIQIELTAKIHNALAPYRISGAQHGTSGNDAAKLRRIARETATTKANVATALQMIGWGMEVNAFGNAVMDANGDVKKVAGEGLDEKLWAEMKAYADSKGIQGSNFKKLNLPFENKILGQPRAIRERMAARIEAFTYDLLVNVFDARDTAPLVIAEILEKESYDPGPKAQRMEDPAQWTREKIMEKAALLNPDKGPEGDFDE